MDKSKPVASHRAIFRVDGMTCSACSSTVERALGGTRGVRAASVSCVTNLARVEFDPDAVSVGSLLQEIDDVGFDAAAVEVQEPPGPAAQAGQQAVALISVELKLGGMSCSACSGAVERHLQRLAGVERATVSLVLNRAFVRCDPGRMTPETLQEEVESIGFDAEVELVSSSETCCGRASLHVRVAPLKAATATPHDCARRFQHLPGVLGCQVGSSGHVRVVYNPHAVGARRLLQQLNGELGEEAEARWEHVAVESERLEGHLREMKSLRRDLTMAVPPAAMVFLLTIGLPSIGCDEEHLGFLSWPLHHGVSMFTMVILALATPVQFFVGQRFHVAAFRALKRRSPNMDVLVSVATSTAYFYSASLILYCLLSPETPHSHDISLATGHFFTMGPVLIAVVLLGKFLEARAKLSAMRAMTDIPESMPTIAVLCSGHGESEVPVEQLEIGDILRIFPGAKIAVDGVICSEAPVHVDESLLTGECAPVLKEQGDTVMGGTTCSSGGCLIRVTKVGCDTALGQMFRLVQEAQASKAGVQRTADKVARVFVPSVIFLSVLTFSVWAILVFAGFVTVPASLHSGSSHNMHEHGDEHAQNSLKLLFAMKFGMAVLMIACPCAMGLATPMAVMVSTGVAAKRGCLVKSAAALEASARLGAAVLDKTGTLTEGAPCVEAATCIVDAVRPLLGFGTADRWEPAAQSQGQFLGDIDMRPIGAAHAAVPKDVGACFWWLLGTLESASDHPIAKCISATVQRVSCLPPVVAPSHFECLSGRGVRCVVEQLGGLSAGVGNLRFYEESVPQQKPRSQEETELLSWVSSMQQQCRTVVVLHADSHLIGAVALRDPLRKDAAWVVDYLSRTRGLDVWLCTGDNVATAQSIARELGISNVVAEALPLTKSECVQKLQRKGTRHRNVCFIGDGINDAPALAQADVGIAIGVGAQIAIEAADVALVRSELSDCVTFLALSKATFRTVMLNFFWAFCFNIVSLPIAAGLLYPTVHIPPLVAGIGMAASSCLVVLTSLRLQGFKPPTQGRAGHHRPDALETVPLREAVDISPQVLGSAVEP